MEIQGEHPYYECKFSEIPDPVDKYIGNFDPIYEAALEKGKVFVVLHLDVPVTLDPKTITNLINMLKSNVPRINEAAQHVAFVLENRLAKMFLGIILKGVGATVDTSVFDNVPAAKTHINGMISVSA